MADTVYKDRRREMYSAPDLGGRVLSLSAVVVVLSIVGAFIYPLSERIAANQLASKEITQYVEKQIAALNDRTQRDIGAVDARVLHEITQRIDDVRAQVGGLERRLMAEIDARLVAEKEIDRRLQEEIRTTAMLSATLRGAGGGGGRP